MPFALIGIGIILVIAAYNNKQDVLAKQVREDLTGSTGFVYWIAAILIVGAIGYIRPLQVVSRVFLGLILLVLFVTNQGLFARFNAALDGLTGRQNAGNAQDNGLGTLGELPSLDELGALGGSNERPEIIVTPRQGYLQ